MNKLANLGRDWRMEIEFGIRKELTDRSIWMVGGTEVCISWIYSTGDDVIVAFRSLG